MARQGVGVAAGFCCWNKIPHTYNLQEKRVYFNPQFQRFGFIVIEYLVSPSLQWWQHMAEATHLMVNKK